jgi:hypothetical protein
MKRDKKAALKKEIKAFDAFAEKWRKIRRPPPPPLDDNNEDFPAFVDKLPPGTSTIAALKLWEDLMDARHARRVPALTGVGLRADEAKEQLKEFLMFEERGVETALPSLLETLRHAEIDAFTIIADMLDPNKLGLWKLELIRNARGAPSEKYGEYNHWIAMEYFELLEELKMQGIRSPAKETKRRLLKKWSWCSDNDIRRAVQWWRKRGLKLKR